MILSIVIPAFNEGLSISTVLHKCAEAMEKLSSFYSIIEVIVVDDGSRDKTSNILTNTKNIRVVTNESNKGYGVALVRGARESIGNHVAFLDADGTYDPRELFLLAHEMNAHDLVIGNRMSNNRNMPSIRKFGNNVFTWLLNFICKSNIQDSASGMRIITRNAFEQLLPLPHGLNFAYIMTARANAKKLRIREVPITYSERLGKSKLSIIRDGFSFLTSILKFWIFK